MYRFNSFKHVQHFATNNSNLKKMIKEGKNNQFTTSGTCTTLQKILKN